MSNKSYTLISPHGGYKNLESYKTALIIYDATFYFCRKWLKDFKLISQLNSAARSGKQCIAEGSMNSGTSKKLELKLIGNARGSFEELLEDYEDYLRQRSLSLWGKDSSIARKVRALAYKSNKSYKTYKSYIESNVAETSANTLICLLHQENFLLDQLLRKLEKDFLDKGGFTEAMYRRREERRRI